MAYIIRNTTDRDVVLDDLRVILGPHKQIDLDRVAPRHLIDSSPKLRLALQQKRVVQDATDGGADAPAVDLTEMEARLRLASDSKLDELQRLMQTTIQLIQKQLERQPSAFPQVQPGEASPVSSTEDGISDDIATRIHAKSMQRLEKKVTGTSNVEHESKKTKDESLSKNIDELENLL